MKSSKALVIIAALFVVSCASKSANEKVEKAFVSTKENITLQKRNVAMHVVDADEIQNIGRGVKLVLLRDLNIKPNSTDYVFEKQVEKWQTNSLSIVKSENFDRILKSGEIFEIENIERSEDFVSDYGGEPNEAFYTYSYTFTFKNSKKISKLKITSNWIHVTKYNYQSKCKMTVGEFKAMLKDYFKVSQPAPVQM